MTSPSTIKPKAESKPKYKIIAIDDIRPNGWNPNEQSKLMYEKTKLSIYNHGSIEPVLARPIADGKYEIIDGYHRYLAMRELGYTTIGVMIRDDIHEEMAKAMTITSNRVKGEPNKLKLSKNLNDVAVEVGFDQLLEEAPYDKKELKALLKLTSNLWDEMDQEEPEFSGETVPDSPPTLKTYTLILPENEFKIFQGAVKKIMQNTKSSEGRAVELLCAEFLSGM